MENNSRLKESLKLLLHHSPQENFEYKCKILTSSSDKGVILNNGKNGARYAPKSLLNSLAKFNNHLNFNPNQAILIQEVQPQTEITTKLEDDQEYGISQLTTHLKDSKNSIIHLGGGHDHAYPLLMAMQAQDDIDNIVILNIDAHCDTRIDDKHHSGTPFRNFDQHSEKPFHLIQFGIADFSNSKSTLSQLSKGSCEYHYIEDIKKKSRNFSKRIPNLFNNAPFNINERTAIFFSLDCDGIDGSQMKAVSCSNPNGLPISFVNDLVKYFGEIPAAKKFYGLYEFNPVFEDHSLYATKSISALIYQVFKQI